MKSIKAFYHCLISEVFQVLSKLPKKPPGYQVSSCKRNFGKMVPKVAQFITIFWQKGKPTFPKGFVLLIRNWSILKQLLLKKYLLNEHSENSLEQ